MAVTYSLATLGYLADQTMPVAKPHLTVPDTAVNNQASGPAGAATAGAVATIAGMHGAARCGTALLCQNPDGSQSWYTLDADRVLNHSITNPILRRI